MKLPVSLVVAVLIFTYTQISNAESASKVVMPTHTAATVQEKPTTMATSASTASQGGEEVSKKDLTDIAFKQIEFEARRLDRLISNAETVGGLLATFALAFAAFVSFLGIRNISELKKDLQSSVAGLVESTLRDQSLKKTTFDELASNLMQAEDRWMNIQKSISNLEKFTSLSDSQYSDAQGAYRIVYELSNKNDLSEDERKTALGYILKVIELGEQGKVDPNLLFNCSSTASTLDFDYEALQLASLCAHWDGKISHLVRKHRLEDVFGVRFRLENKKLFISDDKPDSVRANAWSTLLKLIKINPTYQCELIYSELHNISTRNRESGYMDDAIKAIEELAKTNDVIPSYPYAILAGFYAERGGANWDADFSSAVETAIQKLSKESPVSSWYKHTIEDLLKVAGRLGRTTEIFEKLVAGGIKAG